MNLAVYFIRAKNSLILSYSSRPFLLYYAICWSGGEKKRIVGTRGVGEIGRFSIIGRMVFHILFML